MRDGGFFQDTNFYPIYHFNCYRQNLCPCTHLIASILPKCIVTKFVLIMSKAGEWLMWCLIINHYTLIWIDYYDVQILKKTLKCLFICLEWIMREKKHLCEGVNECLLCVECCLIYRYMWKTTDSSSQWANSLLHAELQIKNNSCQTLGPASKRVLPDLLFFRNFLIFTFNSIVLSVFVLLSIFRYSD